MRPHNNYLSKYIQPNQHAIEMMPITYLRGNQVYEQILSYSCYARANHD